MIVHGVVSGGIRSEELRDFNGKGAMRNVHHWVHQIVADSGWGADASGVGWRGLHKGQRRASGEEEENFVPASLLITSSV